jgi:hypothetical protein
VRPWLSASAAAIKKKKKKIITVVGAGFWYRRVSIFRRFDGFDSEQCKQSCSTLGLARAAAFFLFRWDFLHIAF